MKNNSIKYMLLLSVFLGQTQPCFSVKVVDQFKKNQVPIKASLVQNKKKELVDVLPKKGKVQAKKEKWFLTRIASSLKNNAFSALNSVLSLNGVFSHIGDFFSRIRNFFSYKLIRNQFNEIHDLLDKVNNKDVNVQFEEVQVLFEKVKDQEVRTHFKEIRDQLNKIQAQSEEVKDQLIKGLKNRLSDVENQLLNKVKNQPKEVKDQLKEVDNQLKKIHDQSEEEKNQLIKELKNQLKEVRDQVKKIHDQSEEEKNQLKEVKDRLKKIQEQFEKDKSQLVAKVESLINGVKEILNKIEDQPKGKWFFAPTIIDMVSSLRNSTLSGLDNISSFKDNVFSSISRAFSRTGDFFSHINDSFLFLIGSQIKDVKDIDSIKEDILLGIKNKNSAPIKRIKRAAIQSNTSDIANLQNALFSCEYGKDEKDNILSYACAEGSIDVVKTVTDLLAQIGSNEYCKILKGQNNKKRGILSPIISACRNAKAPQNLKIILDAAQKHDDDLNKTEKNSLVKEILTMTDPVRNTTALYEASISGSELLLGSTRLVKTIMNAIKNIKSDKGNAAKNVLEKMLTTKLTLNDKNKNKVVVFPVICSEATSRVVKVIINAMKEHGIKLDSFQEDGTKIDKQQETNLFHAAILSAAKKGNTGVVRLLLKTADEMDISITKDFLKKASEAAASNWRTRLTLTYKAEPSFLRATGIGVTTLLYCFRHSIGSLLFRSVGFVLNTVVSVLKYAISYITSSISRTINNAFYKVDNGVFGAFFGL